MKYFILVLLLLIPIVLIAQDNEARKTEWGFRTGTTLEYELTKGWSVEASWESRIKDDLKKYDKSIFEIASSYKMPWDLKVHSIYRHYMEPGDDAKYRYTFGAAYDRYFGDTDLEWAIRARWQRENVYAREEKDIETVWRFKFSLGYELNSNWGVALENELFYEADDKDRWDKNRITAGLEFELTDGLELAAFYRFENELSRDVSDFEYTLGLYLDYKIERKKDKDRNEDRKFRHRLKDIH